MYIKNYAQKYCTWFDNLMTNYKRSQKKFAFSQKYASRSYDMRFTYIILRKTRRSRALYHFCQSRQARLADRRARIYFGMSLICISIVKWYGPLFYVLRRDFREISISCIYISVQGVTVARSEMSTLWQVTSGEHNSDNMNAAFEFVIPYATTRVWVTCRAYMSK